ncbi:MAG: hypothetical protein JKY65_21020 [Planctomycetes bacterium]|nr:hypothetical protein [Planctomycetota bacterium]
MNQETNTSCGFSGWWKFLVVFGLLLGGGGSAKSLARRADSKAQRAQGKANRAKSETAALRKKVASLEKRLSALERMGPSLVPTPPR